MDELHTFAARIGIKREWFQDKGSTAHYDLMTAMRSKAVQAGAVEISKQQLGQMLIAGKVTRR